MSENVLGCDPTCEKTHTQWTAERERKEREAEEHEEMKT